MYFSQHRAGVVLITNGALEARPPSPTLTPKVYDGLLSVASSMQRHAR